MIFPSTAGTPLDPNNFGFPEDRHVALAESVEAEFMYQYESMAPDAVKSQLGISAMRIGGGVVLSMRKDVTGYWSKAVGFGVSEPVTSALIEEVLEFYRAESSPGAVIQISPSALPGDWDRLATERKFSRAGPVVQTHVSDRGLRRSRPDGTSCRPSAQE